VFGHLFHTLLGLVDRKVLVAVVDRLELAAVDGDQGRAEQAQLPAQDHELGTGGLDRRAVVLAEVGDGLVVGYTIDSVANALDFSAIADSPGDRSFETADFSE
jgi:hypothetical protein